MFKDSKKFNKGMIGVLKIKTLTNVCPLITEYSNTNADLKNIIDHDGFPYISTRFLRWDLYEQVEKAYELNRINDSEHELLQEMVHDNFSFRNSYDDNLMISNAYLDNYSSYVYELQNMDNAFAKSKSRVTEVFADFMNVEHEGKSINIVSLKPGLNFSSLVFINKKYYKAFDKLINLIDRVGQYQDKNTGKAYLTMSWVQETKDMLHAADFINIDFRDTYNSPKKINTKYARLSYGIVNMTGFCSSWSLNDDTEAKDYIDGSDIFDLLSNRIFSDVNKEELKQKIICSNAYLSIKNKRSVPIPASFMVEKLNKRNLKDRTIFGCARKPGKYVQLKRVGGEYVIDENQKDVFTKKTQMFNTYMEFFDPENPGELKPYKFNVVSPYQTFQGYIEGPTEYINKIREYFLAQRMFQLGLFGNLGFGISLVGVYDLQPIEKQEECPVSEFIVKCNSPIKLWNKYGMYTTETKDLLSAISEKYNIDNEFDVVNGFKKIKNTESFNKDKGFISNAQQVIDAGSIFYVKVRNGKIDLNKIRNIFVGEDICCGFGEIFCYEAVNIYDKNLEKYSEVQPWYLNQDSDAVLKMAQFKNDLHFNLLFRYIQNEAMYRKLDDLTKHVESSPIPKESLLSLRDKSTVYIDDETIFKYYTKVYEETSYE